MGRHYSAPGWYPPMNQSHNPSVPVAIFGTYSKGAAGDDRNRAAALLRGPNTSLNHYTGRNFENVPVVYGEYGDQQPFLPRPRWHPTTNHIRNEPTWMHPPIPANEAHRQRREQNFRGERYTL